MNHEAPQKVQAEHLNRNAFLYVNREAPQKVQAEHLNREGFSVRCDNPLMCGKFGEKWRVPNVNTDSSIELWLWVGRWNRSLSLTVTKGSLAAAQWSGKDFKSWWPKSA